MASVLCGCLALVALLGLAEAAVEGELTMWTDGKRTIEGSSCRFSDPRGGGLRIPHSKYIADEDYCAVSADLYEGGKACGRCFKLFYDGQRGMHGTPHGHSGSLIVKVVDSGAGGKKHFDCHLRAFTQLTHTSPGIFPIRFEPAECGATGSADATVLQGGNPWSVMVLFSNLPSPVVQAQIEVDGTSFKMGEGFSAVWQAGVFLPNHARREQTVVSFNLKLADHSTVQLNRCFAHWPLRAGEWCDHTHHSQLMTASVVAAETVLQNSSMDLLSSANETDRFEGSSNLTGDTPPVSSAFLASRSP